MQLSPRPSKVNPAFSSSVHPVLQRVLASRGVARDAELELSLRDMLPPDSMMNINAAVALLISVLQAQQHVMIIADFDADGATSCALAMLCLRAMGFQKVSYLVPNRFEFGYGLTPEIVDVAKNSKPDLLLTVDNGIASHAGIDRANALGMKVLVTDHHLPAETLPLAECIVNPNQGDCPFASKSLAGVGVVFYLMAALRSGLRQQNWFAEQGLPEPRLAEYLDLVALGTVADVVPLDENNRRLVKHGLQIIRSGRARPGIRALLEVAGKSESDVVASDLGFALGPRLNAAGRLQDMSHGIECLLCEDPFQAKNMAMELDALNRDRKLIEQDMQQDALQLLAQLDVDSDAKLGICLYESSWHQGVIGILASRVKDRLHRPVIVFAAAGADLEGRALIKGSARSINGIHIRDILDAVATHNPHLLSKFGGHAMAAGLTIREEHFGEFCEAFEAELQVNTDPELFIQTVMHDGELDAECFSLEFASELRFVCPWGQHFPEPLFTGEFDVVSTRVLAEKHLKLVLSVAGQTQQVIDAIAFNVEATLISCKLQRVRLLYKIDVNEYRGRYSPQLMIEQLEDIGNKL